MSFVAYQIYAVINGRRRCGALCSFDMSTMACVQVTHFRAFAVVLNTDIYFTMNAVSNVNFGML